MFGAQACAFGFEQSAGVLQFLSVLGLLIDRFLQSLIVLPAQLIDDFAAHAISRFRHSLKLLFQPAPLVFPGTLSILEMALHGFVFTLQLFESVF